MPNLLWTICCQQPIVDAETNSISLINVIEQLTIPAPKAVSAPRMYIVSLWEKDPPDKPEDEGFKYRLKLTRPGGGESVAPFELDGMIDRKRLRTIAAVSGVPFDGPGRYHWVVEVETDGEWKSLGASPFDVVVEEPAR